MEKFFNNFDNLLSEAWGEIYNGWSRTRFFLPQVNSFMDEDKIRVDVFYPGVKKEQLKLKVEDNILIISGEFDEEKKETKFFMKEFSPVNFTRKFKIPDEAKKKEINAVYEDGVLKITIPIDKKKEKERKFDINIE